LTPSLAQRSLHRENDAVHRVATKVPLTGKHEIRLAIDDCLGCVRVFKSSEENSDDVLKSLACPSSASLCQSKKKPIECVEIIQEQGEKLVFAWAFGKQRIRHYANALSNGGALTFKVNPVGSALDLLNKFTEVSFDPRGIIAMFAKYLSRRIPDDDLAGEKAPLYFDSHLFAYF